MKSTFLGAVSHELRTPLAALLGLAELLGRRLETSTTDRRREMVDQILDQGRRLGGVIDDLLDATRVEFGGVRVTLVDVDVGRVVTRVEETFRAAGHTVDVALSPDIPAAVGDEGRLEQVLTNLLGNALKHSPEGSPVVVEAGVDDEHVRVAVVDSGTGIAAEFLPSLFEPFTQAAGGGVREEGIGLGLYITRGLVDAMGGTIDVQPARSGQPVYDSPQALRTGFRMRVVVRRRARWWWQGSSGERSAGVAGSHVEHRTPRGTPPPPPRTSRNRRSF